jgi:hypothetical protein
MAIACFILARREVTMANIKGAVLNHPKATIKETALTDMIRPPRWSIQATREDTQNGSQRKQSLRIRRKKVRTRLRLDPDLISLVVGRPWTRIESGGHTPQRRPTNSDNR